MDETVVADADVRDADLVQLTADVVSAYISNNSLRPADLPALIAEVHAALAGLSIPAAASEPEAEKATSAQIRKSITPDALISFINGKPYRTLKRHLSRHGLSVEDYRVRYGLPADYPVVAASYSAKRSALAHELGLGQRRRKAAAAPALPPASAPTAEASPAPAASPRRGRPRKAAEPAAAE